MPTHIWGDADFDWEGLNQAMGYIYRYVYHRSGTRVFMKEKYGSIRYGLIFTPGTSVRRGFRIILPLFKRKTRFGPLDYVLWTWSSCFLSRLWGRYSTWLLRKAVFKAVKMWPHLEHEILSDADGRFMSEDVISRYWTQS